MSRRSPMKTISLHFSLSLMTLGICQAAMAADQQPPGHSVELAPMTIEGDVLGAASDQEVRTYAGSRHDHGGRPGSGP